MSRPSAAALSPFRQSLREHQLRRLQSLIGEIIPANSFWTSRFSCAGLSLTDFASLDGLTRLPVLRKEELAADQALHPPYGTNLTQPVARYTRLHQTSGTTTGRPLRWLDTPESWQWLLDCWRQMYDLIGLRDDDRFCFPFSFGPFLGFWGGFEGASQLGRLCIAAGGMSSEARLRLILDNDVTIVGCTPTYALRLAEVAQKQSVDLASSKVRAILVAGEPGGNIPSTRRQIEEAWGARVFDHWGMTEVGPLAIEAAETPGTLTVLERECIAEILDPRTWQPVVPGEIGELVVTNLGRRGMPIIRYATGDLVRADLSPDPPGREYLRLLGGVLTRSDDMLIIRGNNVFPSSIEEVIRSRPEIVEFRIAVYEDRAMQQIRLDIECDGSHPADRQSDIAAQLRRAIKDRLNFEPEIALKEANSLPRFEMKAKRLVREDRKGPPG